ncbi:MAG: DUF4956 domain-containing protein [Christensenellales bacterium]
MLLKSAYGSTATLETYLLCLLASLALGLVTALVFMYRNRCSRSLATTLVLLPATVQTIIVLVNGNLGIGVAVAGAFSLVRFRSLPGSAREIAALFIAMAIGLAAGTGYLLAAALFTLIMGLAMALLTHLHFGEPGEGVRELKITVPENLDYDSLFDDLLAHYAADYILTRVRTTNLGSLYELSYRLTLRGEGTTREFLDHLRTRNGNLNITLSRGIAPKEELL